MVMKAWLHLMFSYLDVKVYIVRPTAVFKFLLAHMTADHNDRVLN